MDKEKNSKIEKMEKDIKLLKKRQARKLTKIKFVGVAFDPQKYKAGEAEINDALSEGFEVIRDFETGGGIVMALGKWKKEGNDGENEMEQLKNASTDSRKKSLVETSLDIFLGFLMFLPVNYFVLPLLAGPIAEYNILTAIQIGIMFSTISLIRKFALRRWFERMRNCESIVN